MRRLTKAEKEVLADAAIESFDDFREVLDLTGRPIHYRWSNQLTASAGNVIFKQGYYLIKLSCSILKKVLLDDGWDAAEAAVKETMAHELSHITGYSRCRGHDSEWARRMHLCGYSADVRHNYACGAALSGADDWKLGQEVEFQYKGEYYLGTIVKKNRKRARVQLSDGTGFNVPYSLLE